MATQTNEIHTSWTKDVNEKGEFVRSQRTFRDWVKADGSTPFKPELNRYHLYVSLACPWAHRTLVVRRMKGLEHVITYDVVDIVLDRSTGWTLQALSPGATLDTVSGFKYLKDVYHHTDPSYNGSFTTPVLFDKKTKKIVNNESSEIIRMFNSEFNEFALNKELDLCPVDLRSKIDEINTWVYSDINDGVYKSGFAKSQQAYEVAAKNVFRGLDQVESILSQNRYLVGDRITEADVRLFTTLVRFDAVYYTHFKTNLQHIMDYSNIWNYLLELFSLQGFGDTTNMYHIVHHYFESHRGINPFGIVPIGPKLNFNQPHNRDEKFPRSDSKTHKL